MRYNDNKGNYSNETLNKFRVFKFKGWGRSDMEIFEGGDTRRRSEKKNSNKQDDNKGNNKGIDDVDDDIEMGFDGGSDEKEISTVKMSIAMGKVLEKRRSLEN